jgi:hypothetical protein
MHHHIFTVLCPITIARRTLVFKRELCKGISKIIKACHDVILCTGSRLVLGTGKMEIEAF